MLHKTIVETVCLLEFSMCSCCFFGMHDMGDVLMGGGDLFVCLVDVSGVCQVNWMW